MFLIDLVGDKRQRQEQWVHFEFDVIHVILSGRCRLAYRSFFFL